MGLEEVFDLSIADVMLRVLLVTRECKCCHRDLRSGKLQTDEKLMEGTTK
jgi:hypothetical protein